jgi:hypothetical protein
LRRKYAAQNAGNGVQKFSGGACARTPLTMRGLSKCYGQIIGWIRPCNQV